MDGTSCAREAYVRPHESLGSGGAATHPELILVHFGWSVQPPIGLRMVWRKCIEMLCAAASSLMSARTAPKPETREMVTIALPPWALSLRARDAPYEAAESSQPFVNVGGPQHGLGARWIAIRAS